jgi:hypothetical protein
MPGRRPAKLRGMTRLQHSVTIERPIADVWDYVVDARNDPAWFTNVVAVGRGGDEPAAVGVEVEQTVKLAPGLRRPIRFVVTEHEPTTRSAVRITRGPIAGVGSYDLEPVDGATRLTLTLEAEARGLLKLAEPVLARLARRDLATSCGNLKRLLEAGRRNGSRTPSP